MKITKEHLQRAERSGVLAPGVADSLWEDISLQVAQQPVFKAQHVIYYFGALLMILPLTIFLSEGLLSVGSFGILLFATTIGLGTFVAADKLLSKYARIAAGVFAATSLATIPMAIFCVLDMAGVDLKGTGYDDFHSSVRGVYVPIELLTALAGLLYLWRFRLPFLMLPLSTILWYLGMDLASWVFDTSILSSSRVWSISYGATLMAGAYVAERRLKHVLDDYTFWIWLFGSFSFWAALSSSNSGSELDKMVYGLICAGLIVVSVIVRRRVLAVFGALGLIGYVGHLSMTVFREAAAFPAITLLMGAALVGLGLRWSTVEQWIARTLRIQSKS